MTAAATFAAAGPRETADLGRALGDLLAPGDLVLLAGELGTGKTTFAAGVAAGLGVTTRVTSPTFTLVHHHAGRLRLAHVDLYRIEEEAGLDDLGLEDLSDGETVLVIEWGDRFAGRLGDDALTVRFAYADGGRFIEAEASGPRSDRLLADWRVRCSV